MGVERFYHYITEHGVVPAECGIDDARKGWNLKTLCLTRSLCLWLNKGVDVMHYFAAYDANPLGMGLLPVDLPKLPSESKFDRVATVPMAVLRNLTRALADSVPLEKLRRCPWKSRRWASKRWFSRAMPGTRRSGTATLSPCCPSRSGRTSSPLSSM